MTPPRQNTTIADSDIYTLNIADASRVFGIARQTLYNWINNGKLIRGVHYLKPSRNPLIVRQEFINWMKEQDGS
ncbi:MAG TPA: hypothetical protein DHV36_17380 [Desulfobacteraceae bacterium]|nr:hypothetical protein [Desulfobacteraceae bacterium]